jgi:hypothetical protein
MTAKEAMDAIINAINAAEKAGFFVTVFIGEDIVGMTVAPDEKTLVIWPKSATRL